MEDKCRIWVNPNGLRVLGRGLPGGRWEDEDDTNQETPVLRSCRDIPSSSVGLVEPHFYGRNQQSLFSIFIERTMPVVKKVLRPVPCISAWVGMIATFFWHSVHGVSEHPLESLGIELPDGYPETMIVGAIQTAIFVAWTICFKQTIREAIRKEFQAK